MRSMSTAPTPQIVLPPGYHMVTKQDGTTAVEPTGEVLTRTVAWRVTPTDYADLKVFFETFPNGSVAQAMRFLMDHPEVRAVMASRVAASRVRV